MRAGVWNWLGVIGGSAVFLAPAAHAGGKSATFDVEALHTGPGAQVTIKSKVWITPTQARADVVYPGDKGQIQFLVTNGFFYQLKPDVKKGVRSPLPPEMKKSKDNFNMLLGKLAFDPTDALKVAPKVRTESMGGYTCDVYSKTMTEGQASRTITVWMPQNMSPKIPLKAIMADKMTQPGATMERSVTVTLSNVKINPAIPASVFAIPVGYKIEVARSKTGGKAPAKPSRTKGK